MNDQQRSIITSIIRATCEEFGSLADAQQWAKLVITRKLTKDEAAAALARLESYHNRVQALDLESLTPPADYPFADFLAFEREIARIPADLVSDAELEALFYDLPLPDDGAALLSRFDAGGIPATAVGMARAPAPRPGFWQRNPRLRDAAKSSLMIAADIGVLIDPEITEDIQELLDGVDFGPAAEIAVNTGVKRSIIKGLRGLGRSIIG